MLAEANDAAHRYPMNQSTLPGFQYVQNTPQATIMNPCGGSEPPMLGANSPLPRDSILDVTSIDHLKSETQQHFDGLFATFEEYLQTIKKELSDVKARNETFTKKLQEVTQQLDEISEQRTGLKKELEEVKEKSRRDIESLKRDHHRRLGLRYRLRRARPRSGYRSQREHIGARHGGLLEHRRSGL
jgi:septal ring factor EnvC (AmiA/AmiB activator)